MSENMTISEAIEVLRESTTPPWFAHNWYWQAIDMAITALQAQVPHVLEPDEIYKVKTPFVWSEWRNRRAEWMNPVWIINNVLHKSCHSCVQDYGSEFRCWSGEATTDQMAATPWE